MPKSLDLITIGRSSVDLYGEQVGGRLEDMLSFAKYIGGSPTKTAIGAARLGLRSALVTRVGDDHFGRFIREQLTRERVDTRSVITDPQRLTALAILGIRDSETFPLIFYRENCADMALCEDDLDPDLIASAKAVLINGTHLSQRTTFETCLRACELARASGGRVVFDVDYRPVLWGLTGKDAGETRFVENARVTERLQQVLPLCDLIVGTEEEIHILGGSTDTLEALRTIRAHCTALLVCKRGELGCVAFPGHIPSSLGEGLQGRGFPIEVFNVLGAGDAFMAGFLRGWLCDAPLSDCCAWANACGALVVSRHGCAPAMPTWEELQSFLSRYPADSRPTSSKPPRLRDDAALEQLHWSSTRQHNTREYPSLCVLAMDHRSQFKDLASEIGLTSDEALVRITHFKSLGLPTLDRVAQGDPNFGLLLDAIYGTQGLEAAAETPYWLGRPIESPSSCPLEFECAPDLGSELATWPAGQVVKCLCFYHPDDPPELRVTQERRLLRLADAARKARHELLIEILPSRARLAIEPDTTARVLRRLYSIGIFPDWWKLEPDPRPQTWEAIEHAILDHDPRCRGVMILGLCASVDELGESFAAAARSPLVKGFAVGRTVFYDVAYQWLKNQISDKAAIRSMADRFSQLLTVWNEARP